MRLFSEIELDSDLSRYQLSQKQKDSVRRLIYIICEQYSKEIEKRDNQIEKMKCCQNCKHYHIDYEGKMLCKIVQQYKTCKKWEMWK